MSTLIDMYFYYLFILNVYHRLPSFGFGSSLLWKLQFSKVHISAILLLADRELMYVLPFFQLSN